MTKLYALYIFANKFFPLTGTNFSFTSTLNKWEQSYK